MSTGLPTVAQIEFDAQVKAAYQMGSILRPHVRVKTSVIGSTTRFRRYARSVATPRIVQSDVTPLNTSYAEATATLTDWIAADYTDHLDQVLVNFDERQVLATNLGMAIGRRLDQMILDALDAANGSLNIAIGGTGMTFAKMTRAKTFFDDRAVPLGQRKMLVSAQGMENLVSEAKFSSKDFVEETVIRDGVVRRLLGFDIMMMESRDEGGLPKSTNDRTCFAWDMQAIGLAVGKETTVANDWIPEKRSWLSVQDLKAGAVAIDPLGVVEIGTLEN